MGSPQKMSLAQVAKQLELLEETLIYRFLDRIQFAYHPALYQTSGAQQISGVENKSRAENENGAPSKVAQILQHSLLGLRLEAHETMEQRFGRYSVAEEFPFSWKLRFEAEAKAKAKAQARPNAAQSPQPKALEDLEDLQTEPLAASLSILQELHGQTPQASSENQASSQNQVSSKKQLQEIAQAVKADLPLSLQCIRQISQCDAIVRNYLPFLADNCAHIDDMQYGSALEHDVMVLQCISRRIHFGALYVAEIKFSEQESALRPLILSWQKAHRQAAERQTEIERGADIRSKILEHITRPEVEERILQRVYDKTSMIQQFSPGQRSQDSQNKQEPSVMQRRYLKPENMRRFYADCIIPLTKEGELAYLYRRV